MLGSHFYACVAVLAASCVPLCKAATGVDSKRPNVLFIVVDDLNDWVDPTDDARQAVVPNFDRLFKQGTYFANAHCSAPVCGPSRHSMLSGLRPSTTGWYTGAGRGGEDSYREILGASKPLPEFFREHGYRTMAGGKIYHKGVADFGADELWDEVKPRYKWPKKFIRRGHGYRGKHFYPFPRDGGHVYQYFGEGVSGQSLCWGALEADDIPDGTMPDEQLAEWASDKLRESYQEPFFLAVGFRRPHVPYTAPKRFFDLYRSESLVVEPVPSDEMSDIPIYGKAMALGTLPNGDHATVEAIGGDYRRQLVHGYLACLSFVDEQLGTVLDALEASEHADNTIVVLLSDHGQQLGEKRRYRKQCLWEESTKVPLVVRSPSKAAEGQICLRTVSLLDVYPTLVELCELPPVAEAEGDSLVPLVKDSESAWERPAITTWHYNNHSVRSEHWRYTRYRDGKEELYDCRADPRAHTNLANEPEYRSVVKWHQRWLPTTNALPAGDTEWRGDSLDQTIDRWQRRGGVPDWLE